MRRLLTVMSQPANLKLRVTPLRPTGEGAVVISPTHAETVAFFVETDQWHEDQIQAPGSGLQTPIEQRFANAETVGGPTLMG